MKAECCGFVQPTKYCGHCGELMPIVHKCERCKADNATRRRIRMNSEYENRDPSVGITDKITLCDTCWDGLGQVLCEFLGISRSPPRPSASED